MYALRRYAENWPFTSEFKAQIRREIRRGRLSA
jgi:hypothetical protein